MSENYVQSYQLLNHPNGSTYYRLNVVIPQSLYDYYTEKSHSASSINDFAKFVTPYALEPIADSLWQIYQDEEDFANGVLMIVHQIPYEVTTPARYPVETMVKNKGDCDLFSFIAASIVEAGGIDAILLYYKNEEHMNIGVRLSHEPYDVRGQAYNVTYGGAEYYVAECTGDNWQIGWRVGECPEELRQSLRNVQVIPLKNIEKWAPGQVSASYATLTSSSISLTVSTNYLIQGNTASLAGQLFPNLQNKTIIIYIKENSSPWTVLGTVVTDSGGRFSCSWVAETAGVCYVRASWSGDDVYAGADNPTLTITVLSMFFFSLLVVTIILICVGVFVFVISRKAQPQVLEPQPPQVPS
ncbi:Ig-like domain repeat protein [Candidatus Bathyarchaeota archaeon A05DMB-5]|nr:Ig-like domain repeat protein [Candidatus Bathyarchaeota archaeon A05DMB-5]